MTKKEFLNGVSHSREDMVTVLLALLAEADADYCVIGGLAVNAYAEPVVSLDLDVVVASDRLTAVRSAAERRGLSVRDFEHSVNLTSPASDLRVQVQTDPRYQEFVPRADQHEVLGYTMRVASLRDVLRGKVWAYLDETRRKSKRQKDLADILRLVETHPELKGDLPPKIAGQLD